MPDRAILFLRRRDSTQLNSHPPDSFSLFHKRANIEINSPELLDLLRGNKENFATDGALQTCAVSGRRTQVSTSSRPMHHNRIEYRLLLFVQNMKVNLGGGLCVLVCLIGCVAGCNKPNGDLRGPLLWLHNVWSLEVACVVSAISPTPLAAEWSNALAAAVVSCRTPGFDSSSQTHFHSHTHTLLLLIALWAQNIDLGWYF